MPFTPAHGTCDCCGDEIDKAYSASVLVRGPVVYPGGFVEDDAIRFEWWPKGAYCPTCAHLLVSAIIRSLEIPERYDRVERDEAIAHEVDLINKHVKQTVEEE